MTGARASFATEQWPEADALFRSDPRWLGSDDASSIELAPGRILWLFGDTFIANPSASGRRGAGFPRNSIGIQTGTDPSSASIRFAWRGDGGSFFEAPDGAWYWPLHGARIGDALIVFHMLVRAPRPGLDPIADWRELGALGFFRVDGWAATRVENPGDDAADWRVETVAVREGDRVVGAACLTDDDHLLAYAWDDAHRVFLARWPLEDAAREEPEWWSARGWARGGGEPVIDGGATEFSVHSDPASGAYVQTQTAFAERGIGVRFAERPQGPWSPFEVAHVTPEAERDGVFVYAAKSHPELTGGGLVMTYASNAEVEVCLSDESIYYPRFVRAEVRPR